MRNLHTIVVPSLLIAVLSFGCSRTDKREWNASDHDQPEEQAGQQPAATPPSNPQPAAAADTDVWNAACASCHGPGGKGDGPAGASVRATDLSSPSWQAKVSDQQVIDVIKKGRGRMPAFATLPEPALGALVKRIRTFK